MRVRRGVVCAVALGLLAAAIAALVPLSGAAGVSSNRVRDLESLPVSARGPVAAALGRGDRSYWISGLSARNRAQRLRVGFAPDGVTVASGAGRLGLSLAGVGRVGAIASPAGASPRSAANRVSYARGGLREWYANGPLGLEQGFDLASRPSGGSRPVTLALRLSGDLSPRIDHNSVVFSGGAVSLRYGDLVASDARGRELPAWLQLSRRRLLLRVDDRGAIYPVHVDPFIQQAELTASDGVAGDKLGYSVAMSGDTIVAGAADRSSSAGAAYVFVRPSAGWATAKQKAELTASAGAANDFMGYSVAISGNTIVVGAPGANGDRGVAYVFVKPASGWKDATQTAALTVSGGVPTNTPQDSVAISGNTIAVGVPGRTVGSNSAQGAAYVYLKPAGGWKNATQRSTLTASDGAADDELGSSIALSGSTVVAGAPWRNGKVGTAYVFVRPASGWPKSATQRAELTASDGAAGDFFGGSVGISGSTIVAGAASHNTGKGAAYVFVKPAAGWKNATQTAELTASDGATDDFLGFPVGVSGNTIMAAAEGRKSEKGAVYVFVMPKAGWKNATQTQELTASDGVTGDGFGYSGAISGSTVVAGAAYRNSDQGVLYVFTRRPAISGAHESHKRWRLGNRLPRIAGKRPPVGTTFSLTLNEPALVHFAFTRHLAGRRVGGRCVAQTKHNRTMPKCTRALRAGGLSFSGHAGVNKVVFEGVLSRHRKLKPGRYTVVISAANAEGHSTPAKLSFTLVAG